MTVAAVVSRLTETSAEVRFIKAGTLDDTTWLDPKMHVYCDSAESWVQIPEGSQKFGKGPR